MSGISTDAITALSAFLGLQYDHVLEDVYTDYSSDDLFEETPCPDPEEPFDKVFM